MFGLVENHLPPGKAWLYSEYHSGYPKARFNGIRDCRLWANEPSYLVIGSPPHSWLSAELRSFTPSSVVFVVVVFVNGLDQVKLSFGLNPLVKQASRLSPKAAVQSNLVSNYCR